MILFKFREERQFKPTDGNLVEQNEVLLIQNMQLQSEIQTLEISKANLQRSFNKIVRKKLRDRRFGSIRTNSVRSEISSYLESQNEGENDNWM